MATKSTSTARSSKGTTATATKPVATKPATAASAPHGSTTTTVVGTPAIQVPHLAMLATLPVPMALAVPNAPWPGWGKGVRVTGNGWVGTAYVNRGNVDVRTTSGVAATLAKQVPGATVRGAASNYIRIPFSATGTPQA